MRLFPTDPATYAAVYPMTPFGGLFIAVVGLFVVAGALAMSWRNRLLVAGFLAASAALFLGGARLSPGLHAPSRLQVGAFAVAILLEVVLILLVRRRIADPRRLQLAILLIVGFHFLVMAPAFGPLIAALAVATMANAAVGLAIPRAPLRALWAVDGVLKLALGAAMVAVAPALHLLA